MAEDVSAVEALDLVVSWRLGFTNAVTWQPLGSLTSLGASDQPKQQKKTRPRSFANGSLLDKDVMLLGRVCDIFKNQSTNRHAVVLPQILNAGISTQSNSFTFPVKPLNNCINPSPTRNTGTSRNKWNSTELKVNKNCGN